MSSTNQDKKNKTTTHNLLPTDYQPTPGLLDGVGFFWLRLDRYGWDILGIGLITISLITLMGLQDISNGIVLTPCSDFIKTWLGWGSYLFSISLVYFGLSCLKKPAIKAYKISLWRILAFELSIFCLMALSSISGGHILDRADQGLDGGIIGWGLAEIYQLVLPVSWNAPLLAVLTILLLMSATGITRAIISTIGRWLNTPGKKRAETEISGIEQGREREEAGESSASGNESAGKRSSSAPRNIEQQKDEKGSIIRDAELPPLTLLAQEKSTQLDEGHIHETAIKIEKTLSEFGIPSRVVGFRVGPTVTQFAVEPGFIEKTGLDGNPFRQKIRVSQISALSRDLALALSAKQLRIEAPVPGHSFVGIEAPNPNSSLVRLRPLLESDKFQNIKSPLAIALGRNVSGHPVVADLARMPHLLIAGTTGSGKSICIQALSTCLVMNNSPETLRLVMLDPKMVELVRFNGLPHLMGSVETEHERMLAILRWALVEMDNRYRLLESARARDIESYNKKMKKKNEKQLSRIVIFIDELADLMMSAPEQTEHSIVRLAQMARATGIHMIVATQRPSTDVVTGLIKANFPARVAFNVASAIDSRVILDVNGAENLLGHGDMLFLDPEKGIPIRSQGVMITDQEINHIIEYWKSALPPDDPMSVAHAPWEAYVTTNSDDDRSDQLVQQAIEIIQQTQKASASLLQRRLRIGYPRAARLIDELEEMGIIGPSQGGGRERDILIEPEQDGNDPTYEE